MSDSVHPDVREAKLEIARLEEKIRRIENIVADSEEMIAHKIWRIIHHKERKMN